MERVLLAHEINTVEIKLKNIAIGMSYTAAGIGGGADIAHFSEAALREYQNVGRTNAIAPIFVSMAARSDQSTKAGEVRAWLAQKIR